MINPISSSSQVYTPTATSRPAQSDAKETPAAQDTVHLSPQALAAAKGDVDHDGDSH